MAIIQYKILKKEKLYFIVSLFWFSSFSFLDASCKAPVKFVLVLVIIILSDPLKQMKEDLRSFCNKGGCYKNGCENGSKFL